MTSFQLKDHIHTIHDHTGREKTKERGQPQYNKPVDIMLVLRDIESKDTCEVSGQDHCIEQELDEELEGPLANDT